MRNISFIITLAIPLMLLAGPAHASQQCFGPAAVINWEQVDDTTIAFNGASSSSPYGDIVLYEWDFGDGNTLSTTSAHPFLWFHHTYEYDGAYMVELTVTDEAGFKNTAVEYVATCGPYDPCK